jgi:phosphatidylglycerophosphate synthase
MNINQDTNKIPNEYENFFTIALRNLADSHLETYKKLNFTPNKLTLLSFITGLLCAYLIYKKQYKYAAFMFLISYYFDTVDGKFARKYNMASKLGDYIDHGSDYIKTFVLLYVLYKDNPRRFKKLIPLFIFLLLILGFYMGIQEALYEKNKSILGLLKLDRKFAENNLYLVKYFSCGTAHLIMALTIFFWDKL